MIQPSSIAARALLLTASIAAHSAVFLAAAGGAAAPPAVPGRSAPPADETVDVEVQPPDPPAAQPAAARPAVRAAPPAPRVPRPRGEEAPRAAGSPAAPAARAPGPVLAVTAGDDRPCFTIALGPPAGGIAGVGAIAGAAHEADGEPWPEEGVSTPARLAGGGAPPYPALAREQGIEADVPLEIVVSPAGAVESARALAHPGYGLEQAALSGVLRYRFSPALKDGRPVRVRMRWTVEFRLW